MSFISHADFIFPDNIVSYINDTFFTWSFHRGAVNVDGILRILSRGLTSLFFYLSGSGVWAAYFYILLILFVCFISAYWFFKSFLNIQSVKAVSLLSLFFAINPVFLSNFSKIGLNLGVAMLLLSITSLNSYFQKGRPLPLLLFCVSVSVSLVHPYTFLVNTIAICVLIFHRILRYGQYPKVFRKLVVSLVLIIALNLHAALVVLSTGAVNKSAIINDISAVQASAGSFLEYANTGGLINSFALTKSILKDFEYFSSEYAAIYHAAIFILYVGVIYIFLKFKKKLRASTQKSITILLVLLLVLLSFSAGGLFGMDALLRSLVRLPGGWSFRSPLKWQLYLPIVLLTIVGLQIRDIKFQKKKIGDALYIFAACLFICLNAFLVTEIFSKLLIPKETVYFGAFKEILPDNARVLFLDNNRCRLLRSDARSEINALLISKRVQLQKLTSAVIEGVNYSDFDVVLSCQPLTLRNFHQINSEPLSIYRNSTQNKPIYSLSSLFDIKESKPLDSTAYFVESILGKRYSFIQSGSQSQFSLPTVSPILQGDGAQFSGDRRLIDDEPFRLGNTYIFQELKRLSRIEISLKNGFISITENDSQPLVLNDTPAKKQQVQPLRSLFQMWFGRANRLFVSLDQGMSLVTSDTPFIWDRSTQGENIKFYSEQLNIVNNPSFESGSWQAKVSDCNKIDNNAILGMALDGVNKTHGRQSLQLEATRHTACVSTNVPIPEDGDYVFTFDYQSPNSQKASFYLQFNDPEKTVIRETIGIENVDWNTYTRKISIPEGATSTKLYFYSHSINEKTKVITRYDNVRFGKLKPVTTTTLQKVEGYEKIPVTLKEGENTFEYKDPRYTYKNLFANPSFEQSLWQPNVGDCNRYDDQPKIAMATTTQEKTDGSYALELSATRHTACTLTTIPVKSGSTYLTSFDYQSPNAKTASYYIGFNDPEKSSLKGDLPITGQTWQTFSDTIIVPKGATSLSLYVYAKETDKKTNIINRYDNFKLVEVPDLRDAFYLVSEPTSTLVEPKSISFDLINPTKKQVHIKGATTPFFLGMSESYHDQWQLQVRNEKIEGWLRRWSPFAKPDRVGDAYHYKLNGFLNAWYVDTEDLCVKQEKCTKNPDGSYDIEMTIEFWPQRWFYLGLLISGTTLAGCLGYLAFDGVRILRRKRKAKQTTV